MRGTDNRACDIVEQPRAVPFILPLMSPSLPTVLSAQRCDPTALAPHSGASERQISPPARQLSSLRGSGVDGGPSLCKAERVG